MLTVVALAVFAVLTQGKGPGPDVSMSSGFAKPLACSTVLLMQLPSPSAEALADVTHVTPEPDARHVSHCLFGLSRLPPTAPG